MNAPLSTNFLFPPRLFDNFGRCITYLRLSITDRCNLRCRYCMPEAGVSFLPHEEILSYEELDRLSSLFVALGINKIRLTGGEPFVRKNCLEFMAGLKNSFPGLDLRVTTNGVALLPHIKELKRIGTGGINLSLDTLDRQKFIEITRRDKFDEVMASFHEVLACGLPLKINSVVQEDTSDEELKQIAVIAERYPVELRFIEIMPFSGKENKHILASVSLEQRLFTIFPNLTETASLEIATSRKFTANGFRGTIGLIEGESRKFCSRCNKLRVTPAGMLKNCLYDSGSLDLKDMLRNGADDREIEASIIECVRRKPINGFAAEKDQIKNYQESMATIGG